AAALRHLGECAQCASAAGDDLLSEATRVRESLAAEALEPPQHLAEEELFGWVDGVLDPASRRMVEAHLEECDLCRDDVADLQRLRRRPKPRRSWLWAAAAAAILIVAFLLLRPHREQRTPPIVRSPAPTPRTQPQSPQPYAKPEWSALVAGAAASGHLQHRHDLAWLRGREEILRGEAERPGGRFDPSGVVVDDPRPELSWPRVEGAGYVASIFDGDELVARSAALKRERWTPPRPLRRGRIYTWQIDASSPRGAQLLPAPPAPPARFLLLGQREHDE